MSFDSSLASEMREGASKRFSTWVGTTTASKSTSSVTRTSNIDRGTARDVDVAHRRIRLRIEVDQKGLVPFVRDGGRQIDRSGGLADTTLLVGDGNDHGRWRILLDL